MACSQKTGGVDYLTKNSLNEKYNKRIYKKNEVGKIYKYFISYWAKDNAINLNAGMGIENDIFALDYKINSNENLTKTEAIIAKNVFGDNRDIVIISFQLLD